MSDNNSSGVDYKKFYKDYEDRSEQFDVFADTLQYNLAKAHLDAVDTHLKDVDKDSYTVNYKKLYDNPELRKQMIDTLYDNIAEYTLNSLNIKSKNGEGTFKDEFAKSVIVNAYTGFSKGQLYQLAEQNPDSLRWDHFRQYNDQSLNQFKQTYSSIKGSGVSGTESDIKTVLKATGTEGMLDPTKLTRTDALQLLDLMHNYGGISEKMLKKTSFYSHAKLSDNLENKINEQN